MRVILLILLLIFRLPGEIRAQAEDLRYAGYNSFCGALVGGIGALINKPAGTKWTDAFGRGFFTGMFGGAVAYTGKNLASLIVIHREPGYGYLSRVVYSAGNSIIENAASGRKFWARWHYDFAFIRFEADVEKRTFTPRVMPSMLGAFIFTSFYSRPDLSTTLRSGTFAFRAKTVGYAPLLSGSTTGNFFLITDSMRHGELLFDVAAHEIVHSYQFQDFSGINYFLKPYREKHGTYEKRWSKYIYGDLQYEAMLLNYFIIQGGYFKGNYRNNFLENEAEYLSNHRVPVLKLAKKQ